MATPALTTDFSESEDFETESHVSSSEAGVLSESVMSTEELTCRPPAEHPSGSESTESDSDF